jgi:hypothetical protein
MAESREELLAKLGELEEQDEPSAVQTVVRPRNKANPFDEAWVSDSEPYVPKPRYQSPHEPNSDPATFKIGDTFSDVRPSGHRGPFDEMRQAIPHPRYPQPGALTTPEIEKVYWDELGVWAKANDILRSLIWRRTEILEGDVWAAHRREWQDVQDAERMQFLLGLWAGRGMTPPSEEQWDQLAREKMVAKTQQPKPTEAEGQVIQPPAQKPLDPNDTSDPRHPWYGTIIRNAPR